MNSADADRIVAAVDGLEVDLVNALSESVRIPSVAPRYAGQTYEEHVGREGDVARFFRRLYEEIGCETDLFGLEQGRENCVGVLRGAGGGRSLLLNGHVDVVPPGESDQWSDGDPWSGRVADGKVWGRGACDMKGGIVAQAFAALALRRAGIELRGDLLLEVVVGEETGEHELGTSACLARGYLADAAVVGEPSAPPSRLGIVVATPGGLGFRVVVEGKSGHSGMRGETIHAGGSGEAAGVNAIDKIFQIYSALRQLEEEWGLTKQHPLFRPGQFFVHPGLLAGAPKNVPVPFIIADAASIDYVVTYPPGDEPEQVRAEVERQIAHASALDGWLRRHPPVVEWQFEYPPSHVASDAPIVQELAAAYQIATGSEAAVTGWMGVHEGTFLNAAGIPAISFGPGDLRLAHAIDEHVPVADLIDSTRTYALLAARWCGVAD